MEVEVDNLFAKLGFFTRNHIQIFPIDLKTNASDIDVFALRFNPYLTPEFNLIEVKEGKAKITKLFQLYGFKSYFGNSDAYYVVSEVYDTIREISRNLGIRTLTHERLLDLLNDELKRVERRKIRIVDLNINHMKKIINYLSILKKIDDELYWVYHYLWLEKNPYKKFFHLHRIFCRARQINEKDPGIQEAISWYKREIFMLALVTVGLMAHDCVVINPDDMKTYVKDRFYNIGTSKEGKAKVEKGISLLVEQVKKLSKGLIEIPPVEMIPPYVDDLLKSIVFYIKDSPYIQSYILVNNKTFRSNLKGESINIKEFTTSDIQYNRIKESNNLLLNVLYERGPIEVAFNDFV